MKDLTDITKKITFYVKSKNIAVEPSNNTDDVIKELIKSFLYHEQLLVCREGSNCVFDSVEMLGIHFHTIDLVKGSSHIESPRWAKNKGATINPENTKDNYCFKYAVTIALNHQELGNDPQRISKRLISLTSKHNWNGLDFPVGYMDDLSKFERKNKDIALNILSVPYNKKKVQVQYKSKYNYKRKKQVVLLMITDNKGTWHYLVLKSFKTEDGYMNPRRSISRPIRGLSSKHHGEHYCLGCLKALEHEYIFSKYSRNSNISGIF